MAFNAYNRLKKTVIRHFQNSRSSHDWEHTERVIKLAEHIARIEKADSRIVRFAALLHDIGRLAQDKSHGRKCHAELGAEMAPQFLKSTGIPAAEKARIIHCIESHRYRGQTLPSTLEARVLFDADKLDSIGATGIGRAFLFAGEVGAKLHDPDIDICRTKSYSREDSAYREFLVKLRFIRDRMMTPAGRKMARRRHAFMMRFFNELNREVAGKL